MSPGAPPPPPRGPDGSQRQRRSSHGRQQRRRRTNRPKDTKKGGGFKDRKRGAQTELGFFGSVPSLQDLQRENRKRTRRHYFRPPNGAPWPPPPSASPLHPWPAFYSPPLPLSPFSGAAMAPPAAPTPARFPGADLDPLVTPTLANQGPDAAAAAAAAADKLQAEGLHADLDFYAGNEGLVIYADTPEGTSLSGEADSHSLSGSMGSEEEEDDEAYGEGQGRDKPAASAFGGDAGGGAGPQGRIIRRLRERVAIQDVYIAELEDENLRYQERLEMALAQLAEAREAAAAATAAMAPSKPAAPAMQEPAAKVAGPASKTASVSAVVSSAALKSAQGA